MPVIIRYDEVVQLLSHHRGMERRTLEYWNIKKKAQLTGPEEMKRNSNDNALVRRRGC